MVSLHLFDLQILRDLGGIFGDVGVDILTPTRQSRFLVRRLQGDGEALGGLEVEARGCGAPAEPGN